MKRAVKQQPAGPRFPLADHVADYAADELEFMQAVDRFKQAKGRPFPLAANSP